jgi:two-component system OmpR family sensor kinase
MSSQLLLHQALLTLAFLVGLAALAAVVLRVGLRPLSRMAVTADAIAAGSLAERLPVQERPTEADGLARAVNRAFDAQARAEATARTFAADASHELRTPLATISGWVDLYHQGALAGRDIGEAVGHIDAEVGRMRLIVEELGLLARLDAGRSVDQADVDLVGLAASVVEDAQVVDPDRAITLTAGAPVRVTGDAPRLFQVLRNLVGNAVQHTPPGTPVRMTVAGAAAGARLTVGDDGPGIAAKHLPRVFERFWRAEASRSRTHGGSGLGLAIVEAIVHAHGGTVAVRSAASGSTTGTTIVVELPAAPGATRTKGGPGGD